MARRDKLYREGIVAHRQIEDESELVRRARTGDRSAFDELVHRHADGLYRVVAHLCCGPHEAEEVTQETFLRAWRGLPGFREDAKFFTWLYRIGVNEARRRNDRGRRAETVTSLDDHRGHELSDSRPRPEARAEQEELRRDLQRAIDGLLVHHRTALVLRDIEGLSTAQAAAVLGVREAAFKSRLHRARMALRSALAQHAPERAAR